MNIDMIVKFIMSLWTSGTTASTSNSKSLPLASSPTVKEPELKKVDGYYIWDKGYEYPLTDHFSTREFTCQCSHESCKEQRISIDLVDKLEKIRVEVGQPLIITSGFRCSAHQQDIRDSGQSTVVAVKKSTHELGDAADILPKDGKEIQGSFLKLCAQHFDSIGLSDRFLHVDQRVGLRRWNY